MMTLRLLRFNNPSDDDDDDGRSDRYRRNARGGMYEHPPVGATNPGFPPGYISGHAYIAPTVTVGALVTITGDSLILGNVRLSESVTVETSIVTDRSELTGTTLIADSAVTGTTTVSGETQIRHSTLTGATRIIDRTHVFTSNLTDTTCDGTVKIIGSTVERSNLRDTLVVNTTITDSHLAGTETINCRLDRCTITESTVRDVTITDATLINAHVTHPNDVTVTHDPANPHTTTTRHRTTTGWVTHHHADPPT